MDSIEGLSQVVEVLLQELQLQQQHSQQLISMAASGIKTARAQLLEERKEHAKTKANLFKLQQVWESQMQTIYERVLVSVTGRDMHPL